MKIVRTLFVASVVMPVLGFYRLRWLLFAKRRISAKGPFNKSVLNSATDLTVTDFFHKRFDSASFRSKTGKGRWVVLHQDEQNIYSGCLVQEVGGDLEVAILYKTPRHEMVELFPDYNDVNGVVVNRKVNEWVSQQQPQHRVNDWQAQLTQGGSIAISLQLTERSEDVLLVLHPGAEKLELV